MSERSKSLSDVLREHKAAYAHVEVFLDWAKEEKDEKIRELVLSSADGIIRSCFVRK